MLNDAIIVVGAGYGDEGKGLKTDYWVSQTTDPGLDAIVVRFNGGAQAGHTVTMKNGARHVFSHLGSGTLHGSATYLSEWFVCNPAIFHWEMEDLMGLRIDPLIFVHAQAMVTIPYDVYFNRLMERSRGDLRHGTCGVGFGITIERDQFIPLRVADLINRDRLREKLAQIRDYYLTKVVNGDLGSEAVRRGDLAMQGFFAHIKFFLQRVAIVASGRMLKRFGRIVMEGAQGLALDMDAGYFPHVTRSNTGIRNALSILADAGIERSITVDYITRAYMTRHGAGPLALEEAMPARNIDTTNIENSFQGRLRYAPLDLKDTLDRIDDDFAGGGDGISKVLTMTWLDRIPDRVPMIEQGIRREFGKRDFIHEIEQHFDFLGFGPCSDDLVQTG